MFVAPTESTQYQTPVDKCSVAKREKIIHGSKKKVTLLMEQPL